MKKTSFVWLIILLSAASFLFSFLLCCDYRTVQFCRDPKEGFFYLHLPCSTEQRKMRKYKVGSGSTKETSIQIPSPELYHSSQIGSYDCPPALYGDISDSSRFCAFQKITTSSPCPLRLGGRRRGQGGSGSTKETGIQMLSGKLRQRM
jgi:hypothetical protein